MKIGLLAYHAACNFGAFLQLLSTVEYIKKQGDEPMVINWVPRDFRRYYEKHSKKEVLSLYDKLQKEYYPLTKLCETDNEVAKVIEDEKIDAVIIGSDAICQHHPFRERFSFPTRTIFFISHPTSDRMYPNCFWGTFNDILSNPVPVAILSGSSQDSKYYYIKGRCKQRMKKSILSYKYISVRDEWTRKMISYITDKEVIPSVTPDPVFALNYNAGHLLPNKHELLEKYKLPNDYLILSFKGEGSVNQEWINEFEKKSNKNGYGVVKLPYADAAAFGDVQYSTKDAISPIDWYALIKYSKGYIGNNMHPIISALANDVPFFSFDNYGIAKIAGKQTNGESSKIYHILSMAGLLDYRIFTRRKNYKMPSAEFVFEKIKNFDVSKIMKFREMYYSEYLNMMKTIYLAFKKV